MFYPIGRETIDLNKEKRGNETMKLKKRIQGIDLGALVLGIDSSCQDKTFAHGLRGLSLDARAKQNFKHLRCWTST